MTVAEQAAGVPLYGVVRFESESERAVRDVLITFESARAADLFAVENGFAAYVVCPVVFFVDHGRARVYDGQAGLERALRAAGDGRDR